MTFPLSQYDVVLVYPPSETVLEVYDLPNYPNISIAYVGNYLEKHTGVVPALIDAKMSRMSIDETVEKVLDLNPRIVGIGCMTPWVIPASHLIEKIKNRRPNIVTVLGGFHATFLPERTLDEFAMFDYICVGEGEMAMAELTKRVLSGEELTCIPGIWGRVNGKTVANGRGLIPTTLDELGEPGWHLFDQDDMDQYCRTIPVMAQRGCPFGCTFCSRPYGRKVRARTPALIADEIFQDLERYQLEKVHFYDETFSVNQKWTLELCDELISRNASKKLQWTSTVHANTINLEVAQKMKDAGCIYVGYGVESGDDKIIAQMKKGVTKKGIIEVRRIFKQVGITTIAYFMIGHPNETLGSIWRTIKFAIRLNPDVAAIGIMVPYPGTEIWELANKGEGGYMSLSTNWSDYNKQLGNAVRLRNLSRRQMEFFQLLGYVLIPLLNFRFVDLYRNALQHFRLLAAMIMNILLPKNLSRKVILFYGDGKRIGKDAKGRTWA